MATVKQYINIRLDFISVCNIAIFLPVKDNGTFSNSKLFCMINTMAADGLGPFLMTWINFDMDK